MTRTILAILAISLTVSACGRIRDSRVNPFNWFGRDRTETVAVTDEALLRDPRPFVAQVVSLKIEPTPKGAIAIKKITAPIDPSFKNRPLVLNNAATAIWPKPITETISIVCCLK